MEIIANRANEDVEEIPYLEINLPLYLQKDLDTYKYDPRDNLVDCFWSELYGSINWADVEDEISSEHAAYLRIRYLY